MEDLSRIVEEQRKYFYTGKTKDISYRLMQLKKLKDVIVKNENEILYALERDLSKSTFEAFTTEIGIVIKEINYVMRNLIRWTRPRLVKSSMINMISTGKIYSDPYGVTLIIAPWNYPFQLAIAPLIGAIAAGNCAIIKPSEDAPNTSKILEVIIKETFHPSYISVILGGIETSQAILKEKFDYIFFTGSTKIGKVVMEAAAKNLTPVTLELGGKSPCIVDETANIDLAARRIVWGKFINAGQTCVAPDYLLVHSKVKSALLYKINEYIKKYYGTNPITSVDYTKIINKKHYKRLLNLMEDETIRIGGKFSEDLNKIEPTVLDQITWNSPIMKEEIFGPILPILEYENLREVITKIKRQPKPLALYLFTQNKQNIRMIIHNLSFGGGCINDTIMHLASNRMPFGGVGESGMGSYHGKTSFDTFSHKKSILFKSNMLDIPLRYPPYKRHFSYIKWLLK